MERLIRKRDGSIVEYDRMRIVRAVSRAMEAVGVEGDPDDIAKGVELMLHRWFFRRGSIPHVEEIQDIVERTLMEKGLPEVAKAYILYRQKRKEARDIKSTIEEAEHLIEQYISQADWRVQENSNMNYSLQGMNFYISSSITARYWLNRIYTEDIKRAHDEGDFHIHDLGLLSVYCVGWDLEALLRDGFGGVQGKIESKPPRHLRTALGQMVNFFYTLQGEAAGAQAFSNFTTYLAPFIRYDNLDRSKVRQAIQEFLFNVNTPTRVGFQSVSYDTPVIVRHRGKVHIEKAGRLVERQFALFRERIIPNVDGYGRPSKDSFAVVPDEEYYALGFDRRGKIKWLRIKAFIKHRVKERKFLRLRTGTGEIRVSPGHSLFSLVDGKITPVVSKALKTARPNSKLTAENHILSVSKLAEDILGEEKKLDFAEVIESLPHHIRRNIFVVLQPDEAEKLRNSLKKLYGSVKQMVYEFGRKDKTAIYDLFRKNVVPFDIWNLYGNRSDDVNFYIKPYENRTYPRYIKGEALENFIKLTAWFIAEGKVQGSAIIISQEEKDRDEILEILKKLKLPYTTHTTRGFSNKTRTPTDTRIVNHRITGLYAYVMPYLAGATSSEKRIPWFIFNLGKAERELFLETLFKGDGSVSDYRIQYSSISEILITGVSLLAISMGWRVRITRKDKRSRAHHMIIYRKPKKESEFKKGDVEGVPVYEIEPYEYDYEWEYDISVDAPQENFTGGAGLVLFHNSPFTNITMDIEVPENMKDKNVIIGGEEKAEKYGEFQEEMDLLNDVFAELMMEGDAKGRIFTFPIPTYNITKDFEWENEKLKSLWEMTAKFGIPYFANFVHSDMKPEDARSMCLHPDEEILVRINGRIRHVKIGEFLESIAKDWDTEGWSSPGVKFEALGLNAISLKTEWIPVKRLLRIKTHRLIHIKTEDGKYIKVSPNHIVTVLTPKGLVNKFARDVEIGDIIMSIKKVSAVQTNTLQRISGVGTLDKTWAWLLGFFTADGNYLYSGRDKGKLRGIQLTFGRKSHALKEYVRQLLDEKGIVYHEKQDPRWNTDYIYIYNSVLAESLHRAGFRKYGRLPDVIFNSPSCVVREFIAGFFAGDGYEKRREIHINDYELSRDLVMLYALAGMATTYRVRKASQVIYEQHAKSTHTVDGRLVAPPIAERVPGWAAKSTYLVPGLHKNRMVGLATLEKYRAETEISNLFKKSDVYPVRVVSVEWEHLDSPIFVYDLELEREHLFVHSLGTVTHNCCRLRLDNRELRKRGGGLFGANPMTGSIGVVTINMPRIGYLSRSEEEFFERLEHLMVLAKNSLEMKRKVIEDLTEKGLYPYSRVYLRTIKKSMGAYWANHFSTIGLVGMNEACMNFLGVPITTKEGKEWAIKVLTFMRDKLSDFQEETGNLYNLEATPAEGTSYRLARKDKERFSSIFTQGDEDAPYYTNSVHVPVHQQFDIFSLLEHQDDLQVLFTGGTVVHLFLGEPIQDWRLVRELVRRIVERFRLPYFSITPTFSICPVHGYIPGEHHVCPYPHTPEEIEKFGIGTELTEDELAKLPEGSYIMEDEGKEPPTLFLNLGDKG